jgi:hypothetical protein
MKCDKLFVIQAVSGLAALLLIIFLCGCEVDSAAQKIEIRPDSAVLRYGESVTLTAYNGYEYEWSLQNTAWGTLSSRKGMMVTYRSIYDPPAAAVQVVTVTSTFVDDSTSNSGSNPVSHTAVAYITHIPATSELVTAVSPP